MTHKTITLLNEIADSAGELAELAKAAKQVLDRAWSTASYRKLLDASDPAFDRALWAIVLGVGWVDVLVGEDSGGGGGGLSQLCVLAEAGGAAAAPIPLGAAAAAGWCEGRVVDGVSLVLPGSGALAGQTVSGSWPFVPYGAVATRLLALAVDGAGRSVLGVVDPAGPGAHRESLTPLDRNPAARICLEQAPIQVIADGQEATRRHRAAILRAQLAAVAELVGIAAVANDAATDYAKVRVAFGRPIGSFQAIKHRLVDQRTVIEVARALVNRAADACDRQQADWEALVSLAVFFALDSLRSVPEGATQVFGGIAYTWEHEAHTHLRRAATTAASLGERFHHRAVATEWLKARHLS